MGNEKVLLSMNFLLEIMGFPSLMLNIVQHGKYEVKTMSGRGPCGIMANVMNCSL